MNPVVTGMNPKALQWLKVHAWRGNIRELPNVIERLMLLATGPVIQEAEVAALMSLCAHQRRGHNSTTGSLQDPEKETVIQLLKEEGFKYCRVAERLKITRQTLWRKLKN